MTSTPEPLDAAARARLRAVVFDTNAFGRGIADLGQLRVVADQMAHADIETWVPEPVAWEWAEHLAREVEAFRSAAQAAVKLMKRGGLDPKPVVLSTTGPAETVDTFLAELRCVPHVTLLPLSGHAAREGLRDQILQTGPGRRKKDIKTGASDSAWLRDVLTAAGGSFADILLLTQDRADIYATCRALGTAAPMMLTMRDLPQAVLGFVADPGHLEQMIKAYFAKLLAELSELSRDGMPAHPELDLGSIDIDTALLDSYHWPHTQIHDVSIRHFSQIVKVYDVSADSVAAKSASDTAQRQLTSGTAEATVEALVDLDVWTYELDRDGEVQTDAQTLYDVCVIAPLLVQVENGLVSYISPLGETRACRGPAQ